MLLKCGQSLDYAQSILIAVNMAVIAVAGGTLPTLGREIVTAINERTTNTAIIFSSQANLTTRHSTEVRTADYASIPSITLALKDVHTVISVVKILGPQAIEYEINLLHAAKEAGVKRFAPSAFENGPLATERVTILSLNTGRHVSAADWRSHGSAAGCS